MVSAQIPHLTMLGLSNSSVFPLPTFYHYIIISFYRFCFTSRDKVVWTTFFFKMELVVRVHPYDKFDCIFSIFMQVNPATLVRLDRSIDFAWLNLVYIVFIQ